MGLAPVTTQISAPMTNAKSTDPTGMPSPAVRRRTEAGMPRLSLCGNVRGWRQSAGLDLAFDLVQLSFELRGQVEVVDRVTGAAVLDLEGQRTGLELVVDDVLDRGVGGHVDLLQRAGDD